MGVSDDVAAHDDNNDGQDDVLVDGVVVCHK